MSKNKIGTFAELKSLVAITYANWRNDRTLRLGAGLAYYVVFSLVPMIAISIVVASLMFPTEEVVRFLQEQVLILFGADTTQIAGAIGNTLRTEAVTDSFVSLGLFGLGALVVTASFAMIALQESVGIIWGKPVQKGLHNTLKRYVSSYVAVLSVGLMLVVVLTVQAVVEGLENFLNLEGQIIDILSNTLTTAVTWGLLVFSLAWLLRVLTTKRVDWLHSLLGSAITILFMYIGVAAIGFYMRNFSLSSVTSAFGAVLLVLAWVYYESQILLAGFQLTKTLSEGKHHQVDGRR